VGLCPVCDRDDPRAQGLLAFFAVHETVTDATVESVAALLEEWTRRTAARRVDTTGSYLGAIDDELRKGRSGYL
jgi:hypothetical protein